MQDATAMSGAAMMGMLQSVTGAVVAEFERRTEIDVITGKPVIVQFGQADYGIIPQPFRRAQAWRERAGALMDRGRAVLGEDVLSTENSLGINPDAVLNFAKFLFAGLMPEVKDIVLAWDDALESRRDVIEDSAYDIQIIRAFLVELCFAYPFMCGLLAATMGRAKALTDSSAPNATNGNRRSRRNRHHR